MILLSSIVQQLLQFKEVSCYLKSPRAGNCKSTPMFDTPSYKYIWWNENTNTRAKILDTKCKSTPLFDTPSYNTSGEIGTARNYCPEHIYRPHKTLDVGNIVLRWRTLMYKSRILEVQIYLESFKNSQLMYSEDRFQQQNTYKTFKDPLWRFWCSRYPPLNHKPLPLCGWLAHHQRTSLVWIWFRFFIFFVARFFTLSVKHL